MSGKVSVYRAILSLVIGASAKFGLPVGCGDGSDEFGRWFRSLGVLRRYFANIFGRHGLPHMRTTTKQVNTPTDG